VEALFSEIKAKVTDLVFVGVDEYREGCITEGVRDKLFDAFTVRRDLIDEALEEQRKLWEKKE